MSRITYNMLAIEGLREVLMQVSKASAEIGIDYFIVGALARNVWYVESGVPAQGTRDIDVAFCLPNREKYIELRYVLQHTYNYQTSTSNAFCLIAPTGQEVDLLPFGEIEQDGKVMIDGQGLTSIELHGFLEVFKNGVNEIIISKEKYQTCSIPGIIILKLLAYDDRPEQRIKDVKDISEICRHYPNIESEDIWSNHNDLYSLDLDHSEVSMIALGREMKFLVAENKKLIERIRNIFDKILSQESAFLTLMINEPLTETIAHKTQIIQHMKKGFTEKRN